MLTSVGRFLRKLRIDEGEILRDMAKKLGVSSAFLSAVENGKKKVPEVWITKLEELYSLTPVQITELKDAIIESSDTIELNIRNASSANRQLAVSFARQFDTLDEETAKKLFSILKKAILRAASRMSATLRTMAQLPFSPPSSKATGVRFFAAISITWTPTRGEPV